MRYTEALEAIYEDPSKVFRAYTPGGGDAYELSGSNFFINKTLLNVQEPIDYLSYRMMELDWEEVAE